jgi:tRNA-modifying protein YgfZ
MVATRTLMIPQHNTPDSGDSSRAAYAAARSGAAWFDRSAEGRLLVSGADRASWLQGLLTNDIGALAAGRGCYAAHLTPQGRMASDMRLLETGHDILMDVPRSMLPALLDRFEMFIITEDVSLADVTPRLARLTVVGPEAAAALASALESTGLAAPGSSSEDGPARRARLEALGEHDHVVLAWAEGGPDLLEGGHGLVAATLDAGEPGFDVYVPPERAAALTRALADAGVVAGDERTFDVLRIEAGRPRFGVDMDADTIPLEAGIEDRAISFTKGCYVGQEIIVRVRDRGQGRIARRLVGLLVDLPGDQEAGALRGAVLSRDGKDVGRVTSAARSPLLGATVALGYVHRDAAADGVALDLVTPGGSRAARVTGLPFVTGRVA